MTTLDSLLGNPEARQRLRAAIDERRIPHAMLFTGPEGVGKRTTAMAVARELICAGSAAEERRFDRGVQEQFVLYMDLDRPLPVPRSTMLEIAGGEDELLEAYALLTELEWIRGVADARGENLIDRIERNPERWLGRRGIPFAEVLDRELALLERSKRSNAVTVEVARRLFGAGTSRAWYRKSLGIELINGKGDGAYFRTVESLLARSAGDGWRVAVIDDAHALTDAAENAFLKTLEEPPERALIVLVTSQPTSLLPTTISRCAPVVFDAIPPAELAGFLENSQGVPAAEAPALASLAEGSLGKALELRGVDLGERIRFLEALLPAIAQGDLARCLALGGGRVGTAVADGDNLRDAQRREARLLLEMLALSFRDVVIHSAVPDAHLVSGIPPDGVAELANRQPIAIWESLFARTELAISDVRAAVEPRLAVEALFTDALPGRPA